MNSLFSFYKDILSGDDTDESTVKKTVILSLLIFLLLLTVSELVLRSDFIQLRYRVPYLVGGYQTVEEQFHLLDDFIEENGPVDCVFIGSSLAAVGVNPQVFEAAFLEETGREINCFNFSVSAGTFSTFEVLTHVLSEDYHPHLMVFTVASRAFGELSNQVEDDFVHTPWARYRLGYFNLRGWAEDHFYTIRYLNTLPRVLQVNPAVPVVEDVENAERFVNEDSRTVQGYTPLLNYLDGAPIYWIQDGMNYPKKQITQPFVISNDDVSGYQGILSLSRQGDFHSIFVEMPSTNYFFLNVETAPEPSANSVMEQMAAYAWNEDIPFWLIDDDFHLSPEHFADSKHFYISGSLVFSTWLGVEVAEVTGADLSNDEIGSDMIKAPPLENYRPEESYTSTHGMSAETYRRYIRHRDVFQLIPDGQFVLDMRSDRLSVDERQTMLGFYLEWNDRLDETAFDDYVDLSMVQEVARKPQDVALTDVQQNDVQQWYVTHQAADLKSLDIDYLLYTERWYDESTIPDDNLNDPQQYRLIKKWDFSPLRESYYLMQVQ